MRWVVQAVRRLILTGGAFLLFFSMGALLSYVVLPVASLGASREVGARRCRRIVARTWIAFHAYMRLFGLLNYDPALTRIQLPAGGAVVVANHPSLVDVTAVVSACPDLVFVVKRAMFRSPLIGPVLRRCDHIESDPGPFGGAAVIEEATARLRSGVSVLLFPEGTRSPENGLWPFRPGAFAIAERAGVPIVALFIGCNPPGLMRGQPWYDIPERTIHLTVSRLEGFDPSPGPVTGIQEALRAAYASRLDEHLRCTVGEPHWQDPAALPEVTWKTLKPS